MAGPSSKSQLQKYYASLESRIGYRLFLGGTRHFGYYDSKKSSPFPIGKALRRMENHLADALQVQPGAEVLDAGCGVGHVAIRVATTKSVKVQAIDIVERHVRKARRNIEAKHLEDTISVQEADYHDLSRFGAERFDAVYTMETFVHAHDPQKTLAEFLRVLKPGGRLVLREYDHVPYSKMPKSYAKGWTDVNKYSAMPGAHMFEQGVVEGLLKDAGFETVILEDLSEHIFPLPWLFFIVAYIPYLIIKLLQLQSMFTNTMAAVEGYRVLERGCGRYIGVSATKPVSTTRKQASQVV